MRSLRSLSRNDKDYIKKSPTLPSRYACHLLVVRAVNKPHNSGTVRALTQALTHLASARTTGIRCAMKCLVRPNKGRLTAQNATIKPRRCGKPQSSAGRLPRTELCGLFIYEISPLAYANSVCGFPKGTLRKVSSASPPRAGTVRALTYALTHLGLHGQRVSIVL